MSSEETFDPYELRENIEQKPESPFFTLREMFLLSIIDAYASPDHREVRLRQAMKALFGVDPPRGAPSYFDADALARFADQKLVGELFRPLDEERGYIAPPSPPDQTLTRALAEHAQGGGTPESKSRRLARTVKDEEVRTYLTAARATAPFPQEMELIDRLNELHRRLLPLGVHLLVRGHHLGLMSIK